MTTTISIPRTIYKDKTTTIILQDNIITKIYSKSLKTESEIQQIAAKLDVAPNVYKVNGYIMDMEYIDGYELDKYLKLPGIDRKKLKSQIRIVLNKLYDNGIKHNDLTGKNIMITKNGNIKIIDYGHSILLKESVPKKLRDYGILRNF